MNAVNYKAALSVLRMTAMNIAGEYPNLVITNLGKELLVVLYGDYKPADMPMLALLTRSAYMYLLKQAWEGEPDILRNFDGTAITYPGWQAWFATRKDSRWKDCMPLRNLEASMQDVRDFVACAAQDVGRQLLGQFTNEKSWNQLRYNLVTMQGDAATAIEIRQTDKSVYLYGGLAKLLRERQFFGV